MSRLFHSGIAVVFLLPVLLHGAPESPHSLAAEMRRLAVAAPENVPDAWQVRTSEGTTSISSEPYLTRIRDKRKDDAKTWLSAMAAQLESYPEESTEGGADRQTRLSAILARSEFTRAERLNPVEEMRRAAARWMRALLLRMLGNPKRVATAVKVIYWVLAFAAACVIGWWLRRIWRDRHRSLEVVPKDMPHPARHRDGWLQAAREAAARGDLREAIHCCYWAGVAVLSESHPAARRAGQTPRELLRALPRSEPLTGLTKSLERFWYAGREPRAEHFDEAKVHLRSLGCPLD